MIKEIIKVPKGIRYISDWKDYDLKNYDFPHILNKQITGCGFTEYCINNDMDIILCSPRRILLGNKEDQHPNDVLYVRNELESSISYDKDITLSKSGNSTKNGTESVLDQDLIKEQVKKMKANIRSYILLRLSEKKPCKILVTYDSFRLVKEALIEENYFDKFYTVVDEFQSIFVDSKFKSSTEIEFLNQLKYLRKVCYVSATPMMDKYLDMLDEFKDLPYFELDWKTCDQGRVIMPQLTIKSTTKLFNEIRRVIDSYKSGKFEKSSILSESGKICEIESKEAVIYVNSVKNICDIISKCELTLENTNVLCSNTPENLKKIRKAFGLKKNQPGGIGAVPKKYEPHKMFTLCTRTVYLGADFYSTCARSFIFSDANIDCLSVDISLDLPQILGRQRLDENPWKNRAELFFKVLSKSKQSTVEALNKRIEEKKKKTDDLLKGYMQVDPEIRHTLAEKYRRDAVSSNYKYDYIAVNEHAGSDLVPVFNNLVLVAEIRTNEIQQIDYRDRFSVFNTIKNSNNVGINEDEDVKLIDKLNEFESLITFLDKMKLVCDTGFNDNVSLQSRFINSIPQVFGNYYNTLGRDRIKALFYQRSILEKEYNRVVNNQNIDIIDIITQTFIVGEKYTRSDIKKKLTQIFSQNGFKETPKASILDKYFNMKDCLIPNKETGKRERGFEILSKKGGES